ncbi:hypothetical protein [Butyrivibrio fibrisolvens]|uniref:hypothetical protein n=1 Tax=Butyrivibrio fibrisolvens TaxID=831 RepID=UPI0004253367|nr:hypothetical protein [Butyrivibrio fibrisolvens]
MNKKTLMKSLAVVTAGVLIFTHAPTVMATSIEGTGSVVQESGKWNGETDGELAPANINVLVSTEGGSDIIYNVKITYGAMKFIYDYGSVWDPKTHTYTAGSSGKQSGGWVKSGVVDGTNNIITLTNNSNFPVQADFKYTAEGKKLNESPSPTKGGVTGIFAKDNSAFTDAVLAEGLNNGSNVSGMQTLQLVLEMDIKKLAVGDSYYYKNTNGGLNEGNVYFALSGKPDKGLTLNSEKVGTIGITITPCQNVEEFTKQP